MLSEMVSSVLPAHLNMEVLGFPEMMMVLPFNFWQFGIMAMFVSSALFLGHFPLGPFCNMMARPHVSVASDLSKWIRMHVSPPASVVMHCCFLIAFADVKYVPPVATINCASTMASSRLGRKGKNL